MNKAEFKRRLEEVESLIARGKYAEAVSKCDLLNLDLIDQPRKLQNIAKAYEKCRRYADAEELLLLAREQAPKSRAILFHLCSVATKADEVEEAKKYYREFCEIAKGDSQQHVLRYRIAKAENRPEKELIDILEALKKEEPDDRWMLELAKLYEKTGNTEKAVEVCEDIDLWFDSGKAVKEARAFRAGLLGEAVEAEEEETEETAPSTERITAKPAGEKAAKKTVDVEEALLTLPKESVKEIAAEIEDASRERAAEEASNYYGAPKAEAEPVTPETLKALAKTVSRYSVPSYKTPVTEVTYEEEEPPVLEDAFLEATPEKTFAVPEFVAPVFEEEDEKEIEDMAFTMEAGTKAPSENKDKKAGSRPEPQANRPEPEKPEPEPEKVDTSVFDGLRQVEIDLSEEDDLPEVIWQDPEVLQAEAEVKLRAERSADPASWGKIDFFDDEEEEETERFAELTEAVPEVPETAEEVFETPEAEVISETEAPSSEGAVMPSFFIGESPEEASEDAHFILNVTEMPEEDILPELHEKKRSKQEAKSQTAAATVEEDPEKENFDEFLYEMDLRKKERGLFGNLPIEPEITEETWHFIVYGETNMLTTEAAREVMKQISDENTTVPEKMLKITADKIGGASIINSLDRFLGNMVIIEQAASLSDSQLQEFAKVLDRDDRSLLIAFTDSKEDLIEMFQRVPALADSFTAVFEGKEFDARDLVLAAKEYLLNQEARMTRAAEKVVYDKALRLLKEDNGFYKNDIRKFAELALQRADRGGFLGLVDGKTDEEGYLIVDEKHFRKADKA